MYNNNNILVRYKDVNNYCCNIFKVYVNCIVLFDGRLYEIDIIIFKGEYILSEMIK